MANKVTNRCSKCNKKFVCKYEKDMKEFMEEINCQIDYLNDDLPFSIGIDCDYFSYEKPINKG